MKYQIFLFSCLGLVLAACSKSARFPETANTNEAAILKQLEYTAISAEFRLDTATIARLLHPGFVAVYPHKLQTRQQELEGIYHTIQTRQAAGEIMDSLYLDDFRARFYGNTAVVTFYTVTKGRIKEVPYQNRRMRWYDVWIKENDQWKLVSAQGTPLPPEKK